MKLNYIDTHDKHIIAELSGEMDALGCNKIRTELEQIAETQHDKNVALDLSKISFLDSSGIGLIVYLFKRLKSQKRSLEIIGAQGQPLELIKLLRIDSAIPVKTATDNKLFFGNETCAD